MNACVNTLLSWLPVKILPGLQSFGWIVVTLHSWPQWEVYCRTCSLKFDPIWSRSVHLPLLCYWVCFGLVSTESGHPAQFVGVSQGSRLWEHNKASHYSPSWSYRMPQNFIQQGNGSYQPGKPFVTQGQAWWTVFFCLFVCFYFAAEKYQQS